MEPRAVRAGVAVVIGATTAVLLYAALRAGQALLFAEPDPALVFSSEHAGYFWRAWIAGYAGAIVAFATFFFARALPTARIAGGLVVASAIAIGAQAVLIP